MLMQRATKRTKGIFMPKLPRTGIETQDGAGAVARAWGTPVREHGNPTLVRKPFMAKLDTEIALTNGIGAETVELFHPCLNGRR